MPSVERISITDVEEFLSSTYDSSALQLIPILFNNYSINLYSYRSFKTVRHDKFDYCLCLNQENKLHLFVFNRNIRKVVQFNNPTYDAVFEFITWCSPDLIRTLNESRARGGLHFIKYQLSLLLRTTPQEAEKMLQESIMVRAESDKKLKKTKK